MWLHGWWVSPDTDNNDYRYAALRGAQSATKLHPRAGGVVPQGCSAIRVDAIHS